MEARLQPSGNNRYGPLNAAENDNGVVQMSVDEYEAIRLIDTEGYTQEKCAEHMNVSRSTIQSIYDSPERSCLTRWYMEKCCGLKAANIVFATAGQTVAVAVDATGIAAEGMRASSLNRTIKQLKQKRRKQMKIAIPMNEQSLDSDVCPSFGRAPFFYSTTV
jgi:predicted DNA-binding protein (UPF0251 family)